MGDGETGSSRLVELVSPPNADRVGRTRSSHNARPVDAGLIRARRVAAHRSREPRRVQRAEPREALNRGSVFQFPRAAFRALFLQHGVHHPGGSATRHRDERARGDTAFPGKGTRECGEPARSHRYRAMGFSKRAPAPRQSRGGPASPEAAGSPRTAPSRPAPRRPSRKTIITQTAPAQLLPD